MAVTYSFSPNTKIKSSEVNQDFNDILVSEWATWTPTFTANAGTWTSVTGPARWMQMRKKVTLYIFAIGTLSGTPTALFFTLPVAPATVADNYPVAAVTVFNAGAPGVSYSYHVLSGDKQAVERSGAAAFTTGANNGFSLFMEYEVS